MLLESILADGTAIDISCANGRLIESLDLRMRNTDVHGKPPFHSVLDTRESWRTDPRNSVGGF